MSSKKIEVEGLRGIAILAVFCSHLVSFSAAAPFLPAALQHGGPSGVRLFFVISGYVVGRSLLADLAKSSSATSNDNYYRPWRFLAAFYTRRLFRIVPMAIVGVVVALALHRGYNVIDADNFDFFMNDIRSIASLRLNYDLIPDVNGHPLCHYWSLMVEEHFYLVLPLFLLFVRAPVLRRTLLWTAIAITTISRPLMLHSVDVGSAARSILYASNLAVDFFAAGVLLAGWLDASRELKFKLRLARHATLIRVCFVPLLLTVFGLGHIDMMALFTYEWPLQLAISTVLVGCAAIEKGWVLGSSWLRRSLVYIGSRSYGLYLLHFPILLYCQDVSSLSRFGLSRLSLALLSTLTIIVVTLSAAELCYRLIERPLIKRGRHLAGLIQPVVPTPLVHDQAA